MKSRFIALALIALAGNGWASDFQVTTTRKVAGTDSANQHFDSKRAGRINPGVQGKKVETVFYVVNVTNRSFSAQPALEARYILFVERQKIGEKKGTEQIEQIKGKSPIEGIASKASITFDTSEVKLIEEALSGNWIYADGGRMKASDKVLGIWIKFFDGEKEVGEYMNPTTLKRYGWSE